MLKGKKAVIFDMDGSLVDSMWVWLEVDRIYMAKHNITEPETFHKDIEGMSYIETAQYFVDTFQTLNRTREEVMQDWRDMAVELYATKVFPKPGAVEFLDEMKRRGVLLGIATSNDRKIAQAALDARGLNEYFTSVCTSSEVAAGKPVSDGRGYRFLDSGRRESDIGWFFFRAEAGKWKYHVIHPCNG